MCVCVKLLLVVLNSGSYSLHPTNTCTYEVNITPMVCSNIYDQF